MARQEDIVVSGNGEEGSMEGLDNSLGLAMQAMKAQCAHKDAVACVQTSPACGDTDPPEDLAANLACMCDLCPGLIEAQMGFM